MKKLITSMSIIAAVAVVVVGATGAFFNDTEVSEGNTFTAGAIDLLIDSEAHYDGMVCRYVTLDTVTGYFWVLENQDGDVLRPDLLKTTVTSKPIIPTSL